MADYNVIIKDERPHIVVREVGIQGATGAQGDQGIQGIQGTQGPVGPKGDKGDKGDTGDGLTVSGQSTYIENDYVSVVSENTGLLSNGSVYIDADAFAVVADEMAFATSGQGVTVDDVRHNMSGTGFPEGVVTASVGSKYTDKAATNGAVEWIKASGTGNTGWKVVYGDTGWRNITTLFGFSGGQVLVRRTNGVVYMAAADLWASPAAVSVPIPTGYRKRHDRGGMSLVAANSVSLTGGGIAAFGGNSWKPVNIPTSAASNGADWSYVTDDPWPTTLPGVAV